MLMELWINILKRLIKINNIKLRKIRTDASGKAFINKKEIEIPKPCNIKNFITGLHEIGHIVEKASSELMPKHLSEYLAINYAYKKCKAYNIKVPKQIKIQDQQYIIECLCSDLIDNKINYYEIQSQIFKFCKLNKNNWIKNLKQGYIPKYNNIDNKIYWKSDDNLCQV